MREIRWYDSDARAIQGKLQRCALRLEDELAELNAVLAAWKDCMKGHQGGIGSELARGLRQAVEKGKGYAERLQRLSQMLSLVCALFDEAEQRNAALTDEKDAMEESRFPHLINMFGVGSSAEDAFMERILYTDALPQSSQIIIPDWLEKAALQSMSGFLRRS